MKIKILHKYYTKSDSIYTKHGNDYCEANKFN